MENIPLLLIAVAVIKSPMVFPLLLTESVFGFSFVFLSCAEAELKNPMNDMMRNMRVMYFQFICKNNFVEPGLVSRMQGFVDLVIDIL